ncbi:hypothetical protein BH09PAT1_BH09PAT1_1450 [soil metagenome]
MVFLQETQTWLDWLNYWMRQDASNWQSISSAMGHNPIVVGIHVIFGGVLAIIFLILAGALIHASYTGGYMDKAQRYVNLFFIAFLVMCGVLFTTREVTMFYPLFWVASGVKILTTVFGLLTLIAYIKIFPTNERYPTPREYKQMVMDKENLERSSEQLNEHIKICTEDVSSHISSLKRQQKELTKELIRKSLPVSKSDDYIHETSEPVTKAEALMTLEKIKHDLDMLMEDINGRESTV